METQSGQQNDEDSTMLLLDAHETNNEQNVSNDADDEMLLLSSPSPEDAKNSVSKAGPSGLKTQEIIELNSSNIVIEDSESNGSSENSVEVIGSDDEDEDDDELAESDSSESNSSFIDGKVQIFRAQGAFFIWNAEDVQMLREECRIVGKLVGCLPRAPRQNNQLGLPLQLMPEEAKLLEDIEAACVVEELDVQVSETLQLRKTLFEEMRKENYKAQQIMYKESRKEEVWQHKNVIIEGKRAKKRQLKELGEIQEQNATKVAKLEEDEPSNIEEKKHESQIKDSMGTGKDISHEEQSITTGVESTHKDESEIVEKTAKEVKEDSEGQSNSTKESNLGAKEVDTTLISEDKNVENSENIKEKKILPAAGEKDLDLDVSKESVVMEDETSSPVGKVADSGGKDSEDKNEDAAEDCVIVGAEDDSEEEDDDANFNVDKIVTSETHIKHSLIQLFTENPWNEDVKRPKHWIFPLSQKEFLRYEVFKDLWKKGYYLTSGSKFGGDFLVYPGDPARFHSHFIAVCIDKTVDLSALDIISLGRLGSNVRKTVLLCAFNKSRQISYTSLQWTGIS